MLETNGKKNRIQKLLNLPQTTLKMRANAAVKELVIQKKWEELDIYNKVIGQKQVKRFYIARWPSVFEF